MDRRLTIGEFLNRFQAVAEHDNFDGVIYRFEEVEEAYKEGANSGKQ